MQQNTGKITEAGNTIFLVNVEEQAFVGNDGYPEKDWGKFVIQGFDGDQWDEIEIVASEAEAKSLVETLVSVSGYEAENLRYEQI